MTQKHRALPLWSKDLLGVVPAFGTNAKTGLIFPQVGAKSETATRGRWVAVLVWERK